MFGLEHLDDGDAVVPRRRMDGHHGRLVDDDEVVVFVEDREIDGSVRLVRGNTPDREVLLGMDTVARSLRPSSE
jgi:hypothetical protein